MAYDFLTTAERMLAISSVTTQGTAEIVDYLQRAVIPDLPGEVMVDAEPNGRDVNLLLVLPATDGTDPLLLSSHLDTVPPGDPRAWTDTGGDPFRPRSTGERLIGLGSADAKLDWLCKAEAIRRVAPAGLRRPAHLVGTYGEERGLVGARKFLERVRPHAAAALVGEPTECQLVTQHKGRLVGTLHLAAAAPANAALPFPASRTRRYGGRAAHSATPDLGDSAILKALSDLSDDAPILAIRGGDADNKVPEWCEMDVAVTADQERPAAPGEAAAQGMPPALLLAAREFAGALLLLTESESRENPAFSPPRLTSSIGRIEGRGDVLSLTFDLRPLPDGDVAALRDRLEAIARDLEAADAGLRASIRIEREEPPLAPAPHELIELALTTMDIVGLPRTVAAKAGCTEAGLYASAGIPAVVFGPGRAGANIHAPNEWTSVAQLRQAVDFYAAFIEAYCGK